MADSCLRCISYWIFSVMLKLFSCLTSAAMSSSANSSSSAESFGFFWKQKIDANKLILFWKLNKIKYLCIFLFYHCCYCSCTVFIRRVVITSPPLRVGQYCEENINITVFFRFICLFIYLDPHEAETGLPGVQQKHKNKSVNITTKQNNKKQTTNFNNENKHFK